MRLHTVPAALSAAIAICLAGGLALPASARPGPGMGAPPGFFLEKAVDELELPAEQRTAVQAVIDQARPAGEKLREDVKAAHEGMRALLEQPTVDEAAVMAQADAVGAAMTESRKHDLRTMLQVRALLTAEQRTQLKQLVAEKREHRHGRWHKRHSDPDAGSATEAR
jgi:Spy/CpxP family protein refolding chaperone